MKIIIFVFALIAAVSCDVSHVVHGDGWYKDESGYHYTEPEVKLDEVVAEEVAIPAEEPVFVEEVVVAEAPVEIAEPIVANEVVAPEAAPVVADAIAEVKVNNEYLPPAEPSNDYLPPVDAKKKRQIPVRRQVRKVYRRFVKKH